MKVNGSNTGQSNFAVEVLDVNGNLQDIPFNEIGDFTGSAMSQLLFSTGGPYYLNVMSDGTWTVIVSAP